MADNLTATQTENATSRVLIPFPSKPLPLTPKAQEDKDTNVAVIVPASRFLTPPPQVHVPTKANLMQAQTDPAQQTTVPGILLTDTSDSDSSSDIGSNASTLVQASNDKTHANGDTSSDVRILVQETIHERDVLRTELTYANQTITQLKSIIGEYERLTTRTQVSITETLRPLLRPTTTTTHSITAKKRCARSASNDKKAAAQTWLKGTWLSVASTDVELAGAEAAWTSSPNPQAALNALSTLLTAPRIPHHARVNAKILSAVILLQSSHLAKALTQIEEAIPIAHRYGFYDLEGKAQFHRGLCYMHLAKWAEASWCFVLAAKTEGYEELVEMNRGICDAEVGKLAAGHPGKVLGREFKELPKGFLAA
ncbi:MAG: hypothetical protein M1819_001286 [Sarea resinae]|nr:MAG: hypothetical protein M1819_001286 [Sarea resinae]